MNDILLCGRDDDVARIRMIQENEAAGEVAEFYAGIKASNPRGVVPEIMKTMSARPDVMRLMSEVAGRLHFSEGALSIAQHELIAAYVSALNRCHY
jgi:alkylhydroperoxidase family enzyme